MEKDDELKGSGNSYTTEWRQYDPRLARWLSTDPVTYPWQSDYAAYNNNPIYYADPTGAEGEEKTREEKRRYRRQVKEARKDFRRRERAGEFNNVPNFSETSITLSKGPSVESFKSTRGFFGDIHAWLAENFGVTVKGRGLSGTGNAEDVAENQIKYDTRFAWNMDLGFFANFMNLFSATTNNRSGLPNTPISNSETRNNELPNGSDTPNSIGGDEFKDNKTVIQKSDKNTTRRNSEVVNEQVHNRNVVHTEIIEIDSLKEMGKVEIEVRYYYDDGSTSIGMHKVDLKK